MNLFFSNLINFEYYRFERGINLMNDFNFEKIKVTYQSNDLLLGP